MIFFSLIYVYLEVVKQEDMGHLVVGVGDMERVVDQLDLQRDYSR
jgi:hypothetical protein